ncbi:hypothetical protein V1J52_03290 [Streptomyces sp. TRM 70351]|uniref:SGM_3592 family protein n=1 Tax=Streptomyces sp. TRM 70351 TaxID=3116552 RepID=UPI002E7B80DB|nr:hypothetical protein [Streptomyces sp. TRM 70351]MEE1927212.1 hypothetical protein [Streptomyces sp. TRM 70351]
MEPEPQDRGEDRRSEWEEWDGQVLDEQFIRSAEVSEPAARTRMLRERWRGRPPEPQPWRADAPPAGWFWSRSRRQSRKRRRRKEE